MKLAEVFTEYLGHLFSGRRMEARDLLLTAQDRGMQAEDLLQKVIWPAMEQIHELFRQNQIPLITEHMASRINRQVADQLQFMLPNQMRTGQRMVVVCGDGECEELGAQIMCDLFEASGWTVWFLGSGVPNDEVLEFLSQVTPDLLCIYGTQPTGAPGIRRLIDLISEVGICQQMQILASGGVFNRADGLAEEIGAHLFAPNAADAVQVVKDSDLSLFEDERTPTGRRRKRKRTQTAKAKMRSPETDEQQFDLAGDDQEDVAGEF